MFKPQLHILPPAQRLLWDELQAVPADFVLYGGTAIALHLGHRDSIDSDFFSFQPFGLNPFSWALRRRDYRSDAASSAVSSATAMRAGFSFRTIFSRRPNTDTPEVSQKGTFSDVRGQNSQRPF